MRAGEVALAGGLCLRFPILQNVLQEHLDDYDALLPHLFLADVTRWIADRYEEDGDSDGSVFEIVAFLESEFTSGGPEIKELLTVSFLENLPQPEERRHDLRSLLGESMAEHLRQFPTR